LSDLERGQIVGALLSGASVTKTAILLGASRATVSKVMPTCTNHGKTTSAKRNSGRKSTLTERDFRTLRKIVLKNHRTTAAQLTAELNIHLDETVCTKTVQRELHKSNIHGRATIVKPLIIESNATVNACEIWSDESSFTLFPTSGRVWRTPKEAYNPECLVPTVKRGGSMMVWAAESWYNIVLVTLLPFMAELLQGSTWTGWLISCFP
jgi:transposase